MAPALADQDFAAGRAGAERIAESVDDLPHPPRRRIQRQQPPGLAFLHEIVGPALRGLRARTVSRQQHTPGARGERVDGVHSRIGKGDPLVGARGRAEHAHLTPGQRHRETAARKAAEGADLPIEPTNLARPRSLDHPNDGTVRDVDILAVAGQILRRVEIRDRLRALELLVRLQGAVERRHCHRRLAPPEPVVGQAPQHPYQTRPHRRSYWTKFGSASSSL